MSKWHEIAQTYDVERDEFSLSSILIDKPLVELSDLKRGRPLDIFDFGTGSGTIARLLAERGHCLLAYEPNVEMREVFLKKTSANKYPSITLISSIDNVPLGKMFDVILCSNVFDHQDDVPDTLRFFRQRMKIDGRLILSIPHPLKSVGSWVKEGTKDNWQYLYYRFDGYFREGPAGRIREDAKGNVIIRDVIQRHRTISTYYNWIREAGFSVDRMYEPAADEEARIKVPVLHAQSSRIPYFWILDCVTNEESSPR
jgi:SAM-dependent methyltransferase